MSLIIEQEKLRPQIRRIIPAGKPSRGPFKIAMIGQKGLPATYGGIEHHVENLSSRLALLGHEITAFCRPYYSSNLDTHEKVTRLDRNLYSFEKIKLRIARTIKTKHLDAITHTANSILLSLPDDYDIIHIHGIGPSLLSFLPLINGKKIVTTVHAMDFRQKKWNAFARLCLRIGLKCAVNFPHKTICVSKTIQSQLGNGENLAYIPNGVKEPIPWKAEQIEWLKSRGLNPGKYILFVGRLIKDKCCHQLIHAVNDLDIDTKLAIAGDSSFTDDYINELKRIAGGKIIFLGNVYDEKLSALYSNCSLFVLPSMVEGMPLVLLEAMKHMAPVLASDIPENLEILNGNPDRKPVGLKFRCNDIADLKNAIVAGLDQADRLREMSANAFKYVNANFNWDNIALKTEAIYDEILNGKTDNTIVFPEYMDKSI